MGRIDLGKTTTGIEANVAGLLCYLAGWITGLIFYLTEKENKFVRFHAMQSIIVFGFFNAALIVFGMIPFINLVILPLLWLASLALWIVLMIKAYQCELFKLPIVGDIAERNS
jgi:uncharacterized membrane protein